MKIFILVCVSLYFLQSSFANPSTYEEDKQALIESFKSFQMTEEQMNVMQVSAEKINDLIPSPGLKTGDTAPDFTLTNEHGEDFTLSQYLAKGPVVLVFFRGTWCAFCNIHLKTLDQYLPMIQERGATLFAITPQTPETTSEHKEKNPFNYEILSDLNYDVTRQYNLYFDMPKDLLALYKNDFNIDLEHYNGSSRTGLPVPATYVIDKNGTIQAVFADSDYKNRMEPSAIIAVLETLA